MRLASLLLPPLAALPAACQAAPAAFAVRAIGTMSEVLGEGRSEARADAAALAVPGTWGVGAAEGLLGEITIADGVLWVSRGAGDGARTERGPSTAPAALMIVARVPAWRTVPIPAAVDADAFEDFLAAAIRNAGLPALGPIPFRVEGALLGLEAHVIAGECPMRARVMGAEAEHPPLRLARSRAEGRLIGIFAEGAEGALTHHGSRFHAHALLADGGGITAHVERSGAGSGAVLYLPER